MYVCMFFEDGINDGNSVILELATVEPCLAEKSRLMKKCRDINKGFEKGHIK